MTKQRKSLGRLGEDIAVSFLKTKKYKILDRNVVVKGLGEIDIICEKNKKIIFVEVRTKSTRYFGTPEESITYKKQQKLRTLAFAYLRIKKWQYKDFAIDGVFVEPRGDSFDVRHLKNMLQDVE